MSTSVRVHIDATDWPSREFVVTWPVDEYDGDQITIRVSDDAGDDTRVVGTPDGVEAFARHLLSVVDYVRGRP